MKIGNYQFPTHCLALAPMAGVTDRHFRGLCRDLGADYVVTEMLSVNPALRHTRKSRMREEFCGEPEPVAVQIAGAEPQWMADAARYNADRGAAIIDINMGCPAKKVCNKLAGSALLSNPSQVAKILRAVVAAVDIPVTLKIRTGPDPEQRNGLLIAQIAEDSGIAALAVHGRTRADKFQGEAEYQTIREICQSVQIPVFANGDVSTSQQAKFVLELTGAAGVMVGRAAQGNPWIFREIRHYLDHGQSLPPVPAAEVHRVMHKHLQQLHESYGDEAGVRVARKHIGWYLEGRDGAELWRAALMRAGQAAQQLDLLTAYFAGEKLPGHHAIGDLPASEQSQQMQGQVNRRAA
jgi:tRNA-dihydrouridine synthase B